MRLAVSGEWLLHLIRIERVFSWLPGTRRVLVGIVSISS